MIPIEQKLEYINILGEYSLSSMFRKWISEGYIIHQVIPDGTGKAFVLLYKYNF